MLVIIGAVCKKLLSRNLRKLTEKICKVFFRVNKSINIGNFTLALIVNMMVKSFLSANWLMRELILKFSMLLFKNGNKFIASERIKITKKSSSIEHGKKKHKIKKRKWKKATMYMEEKCISCSVNVNWRVNNTGKWLMNVLAAVFFDLLHQQ